MAMFRHGIGSLRQSDSVSLVEKPEKDQGEGGKGKDAGDPLPSSAFVAVEATPGAEKHDQPDTDQKRIHGAPLLSLRPVVATTCP